MILAFFLVWGLLVSFLLRVGLCFGCFDFGPFCTAVEFCFDFSPSSLGPSRGCELRVLRSLRNGKKSEGWRKYVHCRKAFMSHWQ